MSKYFVKFMLPEERQILESWKKLDKVVSDFLYVWTRWKSWDESPPVVVYDDDGLLVGFHAVKFTKTGYINSVFQFTLEEHRGKQLAGKMVDFILSEGSKRGADRLRMRCPKSQDGISDGAAFWTGFGLRPYGETNEEYFYDLSLDGVKTIENLIHNADELCKIRPTDKRTLTHYSKLGVKVILENLT